MTFEERSFVRTVPSPHHFACRDVCMPYVYVCAARSTYDICQNSQC